MDENRMKQEIMETLMIVKDAINHYPLNEFKIRLDAAISTMSSVSEYNHEPIIKAIFREVVNDGRTEDVCQYDN